MPVSCLYFLIPRTPDDSSSSDTVCMDAGYPKVPVSLVGLEVASVHPPSISQVSRINTLHSHLHFCAGAAVQSRRNVHSQLHCPRLLFVAKTANSTL